jgi:hypothetical protein
MISQLQKKQKQQQGRQLLESQANLRILSEKETMLFLLSRLQTCLRPTWYLLPMMGGQAKH